MERRPPLASQLSPRGQDSVLNLNIQANGTKGTPFLMGGFSFLTGDFAYDMHEVYILISLGFTVLSKSFHFYLKTV